MSVGRALAFVAVALVFSQALAQPAGEPDVDWNGWGLRVGLADDPDQLVVGAQFDLGRIARRVHFEPNVEIGVGDDHTILAGTAAFHYRFPRFDRARPYVGGGLVAGLVDRDAPPKKDDTEFEIAIKAIGGARWALRDRREFFLELNLVFGDLHDVQVMAGWTF